MTTLSAPRRRAERTAVIVALITTVVINALLFGLLQVLNRPRALPPEPPVILHRLQVPPTLPTVAASSAAAAAPAVTTMPVAAALPLPRLELPKLASGAPLALPSLPTLAKAQPVALPAITTGSAAGAPSSLTADPLAVWRVDEPPVLINGFDLERFYPRKERLRGIEGTTVVRLELSATGFVTACTVISSDPPEVFDAAAKALAKTLHFTPARNRGTPVPCAISQSIAWRLPR